MLARLFDWGSDDVKNLKKDAEERKRKIEEKRKQLDNKRKEIDMRRERVKQQTALVDNDVKSGRFDTAVDENGDVQKIQNAETWDIDGCSTVRDARVVANGRQTGVDTYYGNGREFEVEPDSESEVSNKPLNLTNNNNKKNFSDNNRNNRPNAHRSSNHIMNQKSESTGLGARIWKFLKSLFCCFSSSNVVLEGVNKPVKNSDAKPKEEWSGNKGRNDYGGTYAKIGNNGVKSRNKVSIDNFIPIDDVDGEIQAEGDLIEAYDKFLGEEDNYQADQPVTRTDITRFGKK